MRSALLGSGLVALTLLAASPPGDLGARKVTDSAANEPAPSVDTALTGRIEGLEAAATVELDAFAIPTIRAASFLDALRVQGYLHSRDRFAQMDLMRRFAAGELSEIASSLALSIDREQRAMRLRAASRAALDRLSPDERAALDAYTAGVNAGVRSLDAPPPEYGFLKAPLAPWLPEDSLLVVLSMAAMLNDSARAEVSQGEIRERLSPELVSFLEPATSRWDAPIIEDPESERRAAVIPVPGPSLLDARLLRATPPPPGTQSSRPTDGSWADGRPLFSLARAAGALPHADWDEPLPIGSNGWAIGAKRTGDGRAILVNDMHLQITVPGIWYRMSLVYDDSSSDRGDATARSSDRTERRLDGVTLPGAPGLISGSNGFVAWGFTNVEADFIDFVVLEPAPGDESRYLVPGGSEPFVVVREELRALGSEESQTLEVLTTRWGPVVETDHRGRKLALVWAATQPDGLNLGLLAMHRANDVRSALDAARRWRGPQQNVVIADHAGRIGWTISGYLPKRLGFDGSVPTTWSTGERRWDGQRDESERPEVVDPASGMIVTANQRTVPLATARPFGQAWASPDRAHRIRERIMEATTLDEVACTAIQLDVRSQRFVAWRDVVLPAIQPAADSAQGAAGERGKQFAMLVKILSEWDGDATVDTKAMGILRGMRSTLVEQIASAMVEADLFRREPELPPSERSRLAARLARGWVNDESILNVLSSRPDHLLPPSATSWEELVQTAALQAASQVRGRSGLRRWGDLNASDFAHPLARAVPLLASSFRIEPHEQPGHGTTVRVSAPTYGASDRLVVSPGHEMDGLIAIPAGQSANPTSPHYRDLHESWRNGSYLPLRPTRVAARLQLTP